MKNSLLMLIFRELNVNLALIWQINKRNLYGFALRPDIVFYLDVDPNELVHRVSKKNSYPDYYESGTDLRLSDNMLESFVMYQKLLSKEFKRMQKRYNIVSIDGNRSISEINADLQRRIDDYLQSLKVWIITANLERKNLPPIWIWIMNPLQKYVIKSGRTS